MSCLLVLLEVSYDRGSLVLFLVHLGCASKEQLSGGTLKLNLLGPANDTLSFFIGQMFKGKVNKPHQWIVIYN